MNVGDMNKFKVGDWVEYDEANAERPMSYWEFDVSGTYQIKDLDYIGDIFLAIPGDDAPSIGWRSRFWKLSRKQTFNNILKELYDSESK